MASRTKGTRRTYSLVDLGVPHVVDGTSCAAHDDGSRAEEGEVEERSRQGQVVCGRGHCDRPCYGTETRAENGFPRRELQR